MALVLAVAVLTWVPRLRGPIDLRWDASVYYILGTSLAQGHGYRLLSEPGAIREVQYPPLLPAVVAVHQVALGTSQTTVVGQWLRLTMFVVFLGYAALAFRFLDSYLPAEWAAMGALLSLLSFNSWFMSDALYPEVWFAVATTGFLFALTSRSGRVHGIVAFLCAVAAYGFRTVGIVAFPVWVLHSLVRRRWREAAVRCACAALPVLLWQGYVFSVERSDEYRQTAYSYQRAPYMFYNVSYGTNVALRDPFTPEKGLVRPVRRVARNLTDIPASVAEALTIPRRYAELAAHSVAGNGPRRRAVIVWTILLVFSIVGCAVVGTGVVVLLLERQWMVSGYLLLYIAAMCATPFPSQFLRYLMPIGPVLALTAMKAIVGRRFGTAVIVAALVLQTAVLTSAFIRERSVVSYVDERDRQVRYRLFFYNEVGREFDEVVDYVRGTAQPGEIAAAGTPHWIFLRTGIQAVMPPFEHDPATEQHLLDSVPTSYLVVGTDVVESERYTRPVVDQFDGRWKRIFRSSGGHWDVYRRAWR